MKTACVCWTPYQIFNLVNFIEHNVEQTKGTCDLFLIDMKAYEGITSRLEKENIFNNIYLVENYKEKYYLLDRIEKAFDIIFPKKALTNKLKIKKKIEFEGYSKIIASGWNKYFVNLVAVNPNARVILLEDGAGSYFGDFRHIEMPFTYKLLNKITKKGALSVKVDIEYLYKKELLIGKTTYNTLTMPNINNEVFSILAKIFDFNDQNDYINKKIVFLTQPLKDIKKLNRFYNENQIYELLNKYSDKVIVRVHPRQEKVNTFLDLDNSNEMWELLCYKHINKDKVLIGIFSSAQLTPKLIYNNEPKLIFLNEIALENGIGTHNEFYTFLEKFKNTYHNDIFIPKTIQELALIIDDINSENND